ncbi:MAG: hypothetical protein SFX18_07345 [Pirellulales bacterium]|nr:hypothetical protein [Pirellulales bacterium]
MSYLWGLTIAQFWYSLPLAVMVILVYSATRFEDFRVILPHAVKSFAWTAVIIGGFFALFYWLTAGL